MARYTLAVDRRGKNQEGADFISCVTFGRGADFAEKYLKKGTKILVIGRISTGSYTNKDGVKIYTTDVVVDEHEFVESRVLADTAQNTAQKEESKHNDAGVEGFLHVPDGIEEDLPFV